MKSPLAWVPKKVGDLCRFSNGHGFGPNDWASSGTPIIRIQNLNGSRVFNYFDGEFDEEWVVEPGELLFAWAGVKGVSFGPCVWDGPRGLLNQHIYRVRPNSGVNPYWLHCLLEMVTAEIESKAHGFKKSLVHVHKSDIVDRAWPVPPLEEQKRIAEILGAWDEAIEKIGKLIEAKQNLKRGLMQQLLTAHRALKSAAAKHWEHARLSELFEPVTREVGEHKTTVLSITATVGFVDQAAKFSRVIAGEQLTKYVLLKRGEFAYNKGNSNAYPQGCIYMLEEFEEGAVPHVYISFRAKDASAHPEFYKHFFAAGGLNRQLHRLINSGVRNDGLLNLDEEGYFAMTVPKPPMDVQRRIADVFSTMNLELARLKAMHSALTDQKRGLMQKLLTGQVRVSALRGEG